MEDQILIFLNITSKSHLKLNLTDSPIQQVCSKLLVSEMEEDMIDTCVSEMAYHIIEPGQELDTTETGMVLMYSIINSTLGNL